MYDLDRIWRGACDTIAAYREIIAEPDLDPADIKEAAETLALACKVLDLSEELTRKYYDLRRQSLYA